MAGRAQTAYVPFEITVEDGTDNAGLLDAIEATGALLAATVRTTPREVRAFHPYPFRSANREGFAAMGVAEVLLHTHDIAEGLGLPYEPPAGLAEYVLTGIFPHVRPGPDLWRTLLWATGRGELPGRARLTEWRWSNNLVLATPTGSPCRASPPPPPPICGRAATAASSGSTAARTRAPGRPRSG
ncbi:hypothetical protein SALBM311S_06253 [Streptomyces alboniger]